jgi:hypothetical protein
LAQALVNVDRTVMTLPNYRDSFKNLNSRDFDRDGNAFP